MPTYTEWLQQQAQGQQPPEQLGIDLSRGGMPIDKLGMDLGALREARDQGSPAGVGLDLTRGGMPIGELGMDLGALRDARGPAPAAKMTAPAVAGDMQPAMPQGMREAFLAKLQEAQSKDEEQRSGLRMRMALASMFARPNPEIVKLAEPRNVANLSQQMEAGKSLDEQDRAAQSFAPKLRSMNAQATDDEEGAKFAGPNAAAKARKTSAEADLDTQKAAAGQQDMEARAAALRDARDENSQSSQVARQIAEQAGIKIPPSAPAAAFQQWLKDAVEMKNTQVRADATTKSAATRASITVNAGGAPLSDPALDQAAERYARTLELPPFARGAAGEPERRRIINRASELYPGQDFVSNRANIHANAKSLDKQTLLLDLTKSWEATGSANLAVLKDAASALVNTGSPLANKPLRWLYQNAAGDPTMIKFRTAHAAVVNEYAKILSGSMGSAAVTDSARREAEGMLPLDGTPAQIAAAASVLETDAANRLGAMAKQVETTQGRIGGKKTAEAPAGGTVTVNWKGKNKVIPTARLRDALAAGATEVK